MAQGIPEEPSPEDEGAEPTAGPDDPCSSCRGRGQKLVTMRRAEAAAGAAAETALLGRAQEDCLTCSGTGNASAASAGAVDSAPSAPAGS
jgi:hypothetical protein